MQNSSDLDPFKLEMPQKCITFEPKVRFTKFKGLNRSEFHQKLEFSSKFLIFCKKKGGVRPPHVRPWYFRGYILAMLIFFLDSADMYIPFFGLITIPRRSSSFSGAISVFKLNLLRMEESINFSSIIANFCPKQDLGPAENGR